ncbi:MAG: hypothetical protein ACJ74T_22950 [Pyrinomonadaceae bacterium]
MSQQDPPIIVTGGSVTLVFDEDKLPKLSKGKHHHKDKRIRRIEIDGDGIDYAVDVPTGEGLTITIRIGD